MAGKSHFHGCDEDCFNCQYEDCKKPAYLIRATPHEDEQRSSTNRKKKVKT